MYEDPVIYNTTYTTTTQPEINPIVWVVWLVVVIFMIAAMWRIYTKAGKPGWAASSLSTTMLLCWRLSEGLSGGLS